MYSTIPLNTDNYDQRFEISIPLNEDNVRLLFRIRYNMVGDFWSADIANAISGEMLLSKVPFVTGEYLSGNLLRQFKHLGIGAAAIIKKSMDCLEDYPNYKQLGNEFIFVWGDWE